MQGINNEQRNVRQHQYHELRVKMAKSHKIVWILRGIERLIKDHKICTLQLKEVIGDQRNEIRGETAGERTKRLVVRENGARSLNVVPPRPRPFRLFDDSNEFITQPIGIHHAQTFFFRWYRHSAMPLNIADEQFISRSSRYRLAYGVGTRSKAMWAKRRQWSPVVMRFTWHTSINVHHLHAGHAHACKISPLLSLSLSLSLFIFSHPASLLSQNLQFRVRRRAICVEFRQIQRVFGQVWNWLKIWKIRLPRLERRDTFNRSLEMVSTSLENFEIRQIQP